MLIFLYKLHFSKITLAFLLILLVLTSNCGSQQKSLNHIFQQQNIYFKPTSSVQEYVNRVAKRLAIVNHYPSAEKLNFVFNLNNNQFSLINYPDLLVNSYHKINNHNFTINLSTTLLDYLQNEAELATILAISMEFSMYQKIDYAGDLRIIQLLYRAGYDPTTLLELQQEYWQGKTLNDNWLNNIFMHQGIDQARINHTAKIVAKVTKGLQRNQESYLSNIYLL